jgi:hypothetical protein
MITQESATNQNARLQKENAEIKTQSSATLSCDVRKLQAKAAAEKFKQQ